MSAAPPEEQQVTTAASPATGQTASALQAELLALRRANVNPLSLRLSSVKLREMKSDVKKASGFGRKLRLFSGGGGTEATTSILTDLNTINLNMFITEAAQAVPQCVTAEARLKWSNVPCIVQCCCWIHQRYEKFQADLATHCKSLLWSGQPFVAPVNPSSVGPTGGGPVPPAAAASGGALTATQNVVVASTLEAIQEEMKAKFDMQSPPWDAGRFKVGFRLVLELWSNGVLPRAGPLSPVDIIGKMDKLFEANKGAHHTINSLHVLLVIVRFAGVEMFPELPGHAYVEAAAPTLPSTDTQPSTTPGNPMDTLLAVPAARDSAEQRRQCVAEIATNVCFEPYIGTAAERETLLAQLNKLVTRSNEMCKKLKASCEDRWRALCETIELRGENATDVQKFRDVKKEVDRYLLMTEQLLVSLGRAADVTPAVNLKQALTSSSADGSALVVISRIADFYSVAEAETIDYFDDEDQRSFYEDVPDITEYLPPEQVQTAARIVEDEAEEKTITALKYDTIDELIQRLPQSAVATKYVDEWLVSFLVEASRYYNPSNQEQPPSPNKENAEPTPPAGATDAPPPAAKPAPFLTPAELDQARAFFTNCRKRLNQELRCVATNASELVPFYCRIVATMSKPHFPDTGENLVTKFEGELHHILTNKTPMAFGRKQRAARFVTELVKFRLAPPIRAIRCMNHLIEELDSTQNVEVLIQMIDTIGPYLMRGGVTRVKLEETLVALTKKLNVVSLTTAIEDMLRSSIQNMRLTVARGTSGKSAVVARSIFCLRTPLESYLRMLLGGRLREESLVGVRDQIRKLPWTDPTEGKKLALLLRKSTDIVAWDKLHLVAEIISDTCDRHGWVGVFVVDALLEDLRSDLEIPVSFSRLQQGPMQQGIQLTADQRSSASDRTLQERLQDLKLLGELFNYRIVGFPLLSYVFLQMLLYHPYPSNALDYSRIRCITVLFDVAGPYFLVRQVHSHSHDYDERSKPTAAAASVISASLGRKLVVRRILAYFACLVHAKAKPLPLDLDGKIEETILRMVMPKVQGRYDVGDDRTTRPPRMTTSSVGEPAEDDPGLSITLPKLEFPATGQTASQALLASLLETQHTRQLCQTQRHLFRPNAVLFGASAPPPPRGGVRRVVCLEDADEVVTLVDQLESTIAAFIGASGPLPFSLPVNHTAPPMARGIGVSLPATSSAEALSMALANQNPAYRHIFSVLGAAKPVGSLDTLDFTAQSGPLAMPIEAKKAVQQLVQQHEADVAIHDTTRSAGSDSDSDDSDDHEGDDSSESASSEDGHSDEDGDDGEERSDDDDDDSGDEESDEEGSGEEDEESTDEEGSDEGSTDEEREEGQDDGAAQDGKSGGPIAAEATSVEIGATSKADVPEDAADDTERGGSREMFSWLLSSRKGRAKTEEELEYDRMLKETYKESTAEAAARAARTGARGVESQLENRMKPSVTQYARNATMASAAKFMLRQPTFAAAGGPDASSRPTGGEGRGESAAAAPAVAAPVQRIAVLRRTGPSDRPSQQQIEAKAIFIPGASDFAQRATLARESHLQETDELRRRTLLMGHAIADAAAGPTAGGRGRGGGPRR